MGGEIRLEPIAGGGFCIGAELLGRLLDLEPAEVPALMRAGRITGRFECGEGEDEGRFRVTFRHGARRVRLTLDAEGRVLTRSRFTVAPRPE